MRILFLASNPDDFQRLNLEEEFRAIKEKMHRAKLGHSIDVRSCWAVRAGDLQQALLDTKPDVVHFSGHGTDAGEILLHGAMQEGETWISSEALAGLFRVLRDNIRMVVLNACFSRIQADAIVKEIDIVIGMSGAIGDEAARLFAAALYRGLASGKSVQTAYDLGVNELKLNGFEIDQQFPELHTRPGIDASQVILVKPVEQPAPRPGSTQEPQLGKSPFAEKEYEQLRDEFCEYMLRELDFYDSDLNWNDSDYTNLEAEVEVDRRGVRNPRVERDLVRAICRDHTSRSFLLLGDPGSGKSVSLRRLLRQLYAKVKQTETVPIYVNLREWDGSSSPDDQELSYFIFRTLERSAGMAGRKFLERWYEPMLRSGRFFFLLDSFDEMPMVLDCDDASPKIKEVSRTVDRFFHDLHNCRGVLASRRFRQPRGFRGRRISIRPLKESQIRRAMTHWLVGWPMKPKRIIRKLFQDRPELVPVVRNPFLAHLTAQYLIQHHGELPPNQFAIYEDNIIKLLEDKDLELREFDLETSQLLEVATRIAREMYEDSSVGLEIEIGRLGTMLGVENSELTIQALRLCRIVRLGGERSLRLSFVHRRFAEFFVVRSLIKEGQEIPFEAIVEDSRWRDCLVVYCGIAPAEQVQSFANFSWSVLEQLSLWNVHELTVHDVRPGVHSLRFLRDAFIARPEFLDEFRSQLEELILSWLRGPDILIAKLAAESLGLLGPGARTEGIQIAFGRDGVWLKETALHACRSLGSLEKPALRSIRSHIRTLPTPRILADFRDLEFSFSLSQNLRGQLWALRMDVFWLLILWTVVPWCLYYSLSQFTAGSFLDYVSIVLVASLLLELIFYFDSIVETGTGSKYSRKGLDTSLRFILAPIGAINILVQLTPPISFGLPIITSITFLLLSLPWDLPLVVKEIIREEATLIKEHKFFLWFYFLGPPLFWAFVNTMEIAAEHFPMIQLTAKAFVQGFLLIFVALPLFHTACIINDIFVLQSLRTPGPVTYHLVYKALDQLITNWAKCRFLDNLRLQSVEVTGERPHIPERYFWDERVRESMARLEAMWLGLEE